MDSLAVVDAGRISVAAMERLRASPYKALRQVSCECRHGDLFLNGHLFSLPRKVSRPGSCGRGQRGDSGGQRNRSGMIEPEAMGHCHQRQYDLGYGQRE